MVQALGYSVFSKGAHQGREAYSQPVRHTGHLVAIECALTLCLCSKHYPEPVLQALGYSISSVDAYQGRDADIVIFSAVRHYPEGVIGFVRDPRRMNVAFTRPRRCPFNGPRFLFPELIIEL